MRSPGRRETKLPSFQDLLAAVTSLPWLIAQFLVLAFCGWCMYIYLTKEQGSATDIALFIFVTSIMCVVQQFVHVLLLITVRCDGRCDRRKQKVEDDDGDYGSSGASHSDDDYDEEHAQRRRLVRSPASDKEASSGEAVKAGARPAVIAITVLLSVSAVVIAVFAGWMVYGCILVFKHPIQDYRGSSVLFYSAGLGWCVWFFFLLFVACAVPLTLGVGECCDSPPSDGDGDDDGNDAATATAANDSSTTTRPAAGEAGPGADRTGDTGDGSAAAAAAAAAGALGSDGSDDDNDDDTVLSVDEVEALLDEGSRRDDAEL